MICSEIHHIPSSFPEEIPCPQDIPAGRGWKFCPRCGRKTAHLPLDTGIVLAVRPNTPEIATALSLRGEGLTETSVTLTLNNPLAGVTLVTAPSLAIQPGAPVSVKLKLPAMQATRQTGRLEVTSDDGPRDLFGDPWQPAPPRTRRLPIRFNVDRPAEVRLGQEAVFFREGVPDRTIVLRNAGDVSAEVVEVEVPDGYEVTPLDGIVPKRGQLSLLARRIPGKALPESAKATIHFSDNSTQEVAFLHRAAGPGGVLPRAIIGIDFGTAFTSVVFREYRMDDHEDEAAFLGLAGEEDPRRFRTRIWIGEDGAVKCAGEATARYNESASDGFLFREIKTLLRDPSRTDLIYPQRQERVDAALSMMKRQHGDAWTQWLVTRYLSWLRQTLVLPELQRRYPGVSPRIVYVFSLPVLDFKAKGDHPIYDLQRRQMEQCIEAAGFPMNTVQFQFEPVCAALGLLHPQADNAWPALGTQSKPINGGDTIALFDSGGGTTDVVLMRAEREGEKVVLNVEKCLGVGSDAETFGGEIVTTDLIKAVRDPNFITLDRVGPWFNGSISEETVFENYGLSEVQQRDEAETIKRELGESEVVEHHDATLRQSLLFYLTRRYLKSLYDVLPEQIFSSVPAEKTTYYMGLGGNVMIPVVNKWISLVMHDDQPDLNKRRLEWPESYRKLAVAYGTVWVYDSLIRNAVPYALRLYIGNEVGFELNANKFEQTMPDSQQLLLSESETREFRVMAHLGNAEYLVDSGWIVNGPERLTYDLSIGAQNGRVRVSYRPKGAAEDTLLIDYRL